MIRFLLFFVGAYLVLAILIQIIANDIIYQPPKPSTYDDNASIFKIPMSDGTQLSATYLENPDAKYTMLYLHGNAGDLGNLPDILRFFHDHGYAILSYDYPGYGTSSGKPSEKALYQSAHAVYDYMVNTLKIPPSNIIVYGQSLGAAVGLELAINNKIGGVVMESPFLSAFRAVTQIPLFPLDRYNNAAKIKKLTVPLLVIHGTSDSEIGFWQGKSLYKRAPEPKDYYWVEGADHNTILSIARDELFTKLNGFTEAFADNKKPRKNTSF